MSFTAHHLYFDDVEVGQEWDSAGRTITETDVVNFAGISGDFNAIHVDHEFAKKSHFQKPIAHGLLVQAIASGLQPNERVIINGIQRVKPGTVVSPQEVPMPIPRPGELQQTPPAVLKAPPAAQAKQ